MSKIFGHSMKSIGSNAGLLTEENEISTTFETRSLVRKDDADVFVKPSVPKLLGSLRNAAKKSALFFSHSESSDVYEEISKIDFEASTSAASFQPITHRQNDPMGTHYQYVRPQERRLFCPAPRKTLFNSRMQSRGQDSFLGRQTDELSTKRLGGLGPSSSMLSSVGFSEMSAVAIPGTTATVPDENCKQDGSLSLSKKFNLGLRNNPLSVTASLENLNRLNSNMSFRSTTILPSTMYNNSGLRDSVDKQFNRDRFCYSSVESCKNKNALINMPTAPRSVVQSKSMISGINPALDKTRSIEEVRSESCFVRPSLSGGIKPRAPITSTRLFNPNFEHCPADTSLSSRFRANNIPRRDCDTLSDSRLVLTRDNHLETGSLAGLPLISIGTVMNVLETLHHSVLYTAPNVPVEKIKQAFDQAKEMIENKSEVSFVHSVRDIDAASVASYSSRHIGPTLLDKETTEFGGTIDLKNGKDILNSLMSKSAGGKFKKLSSIQEEKLCSQTGPKGAGDPSPEDEEDSALIFRKPKPLWQNQKKKILTIKTPQPQKTTLSKETKQIINLKKWYPVISGKELTFKGTAENGTCRQTEAVKKRVTNRKMLLINGLECNLIGSPLDAIISALPKNLASRLADGLTARWKIFQKELIDHQSRMKNGNLLKWIDVKEKKSSSPTKSANSTTRTKRKSNGDGGPKAEEEKIAIYDTTPTTRREKYQLKKTDKTKKSSGKTPLRVAVASTKKKKLKTPSKSSEKKKTKKSFGGGKSTGNTSHNKSKRETPKGSVNKTGEESSKGGTPKKSANRRNTPKETETTMSEKGVKSDRSKRITPNQRRDTPVNGSTAKKNIAETASRTRSGKRYIATDVTQGNAASTETPKGSKKLPGKSKENIDSQTKTPPSATGKEILEKGSEQVSKIGSTTDEETHGSKRRKRRMSIEADSTLTKKSKLEASAASPKGKPPEKSSQKMTLDSKKKNKTVQQNKSEQSKNVSSTSGTVKKVQTSKAEGKSNKKSKTVKVQKTTVSKEIVNTSKTSEEVNNATACEVGDDSMLGLDKIEIPERVKMSGKIRLNRSEMRHLCAETPPLKYFNSNLKLLKTITPVSSPNWCISQRTETEVKQFQRRQVMAQKKKTTVVEEKRGGLKTKTTGTKNREVKSVLNWVADKAVRTPTGTSKLLRLILPSRKQVEAEEDEEEAEGMEGIECDPFLV